MGYKVTRNNVYMHCEHLENNREPNCSSVVATERGRSNS